MNPIKYPKYNFGPLMLTLAVASITVFSGCDTAGTAKKSTEPPAKLKDVVTNVVDLRNRIRDGFATDNVDMAHGPLHSIGHELEKLAAAATAEGLEADQIEVVRKASDELFEAFNQVDLTLHGKEGKTYEEVSEAVDSALKQITDIAGVKNGGSAKSESDSSPETSLLGDGLPAAGDDAVVEESSDGGEGSATTEEDASSDDTDK